MTLKAMAVLAIGLVAWFAISPISFLRGAAGVGAAPALKFMATDGTQVDLEKLRGKIVVVDFWATWCGPCMSEASHMVEINRQYGPMGVALIGVSLDQDAAKMKAVAQQQGFSWPQYFDGLGWENRIARAWGVRTIPRTFILDPEGRVVWSGHPAQLDAQLIQAIREHPPTRTSAPGNNAVLDRAGYDQARALAAEVRRQSQSQAALEAAGRLAAQNRPAEAYQAYQQIIRDYAGTPAAEEAAAAAKGLVKTAVPPHPASSPPPAVPTAEKKSAAGSIVIQPVRHPRKP